MSVSTKSSDFHDTTNGGITRVHSVKVTKSNKKGVQTLIGGTSIQTQPDGSFYIPILTEVGDRKVTLDVRPNDIVFQTGRRKRWQVLSTKAFNRRFKVIKS